MKDYSINKFGIANFKAISNFTEIEFNPISLLNGDNNSGKTSFLNALITFVESKEHERYLDIQPFYFDNAGNYLDFENVINKYSRKDSTIEYQFRIAKKPKESESEVIKDMTYEKYDVSIKFGMDMERIRLKETKINVINANDDETEILHFTREEKRNILKLNINYVFGLINTNYFYRDICESETDKLISEKESKAIEKEILNLGAKEYSEDRHYENGVNFPRTLLGVIRYYKYFLSGIIYDKYGKDLSSIQYKYGNKLVESVYEFIKTKLALITDAIDVKYVECRKLKVESKVLPQKYYNDDTFKKKFIDYIEEMKYDNNILKLMKTIVNNFNIANDISIEGDYTGGYSIYINNNGIKTNLADAERSIQQIVALVLSVLINGKFNLYFKGESKEKFYEPDYKPILIENPEYNLNESHQKIFSDIILFLSKKLNTQMIIETQSKIIIDRLKETGNSKVYYIKQQK